jgi:hypothetical protein
MGEEPPTPTSDDRRVDGDLLRCSFCGRSQKQVRKLIAGPGVYICDGCAVLARQWPGVEAAPRRCSFCGLTASNS